MRCDVPEEFLDYYRDRYSDEENLQYWNSLNPDQCLWDATNSWGKGLNSAGDGTVTWAYEVYAVRQNHEKPGHLTVDLKNPNSILHSRIVQYLSRSAPALELVNAEPESFFRSLEVSQLPPKMLQSFLRQQSLQSLIDKLPPQHPYLSVPGISIPQLVLLEWASKLSRESLLVFIKDIRSDRSFLHVLTVAALNKPGLREIIEASPEQLAELVDRSQNDVLKSALPRALFNAISTNQAAALPKLFDTLATIGEPWGIFEYQSGGWRDFLVHFVEEDSCTDLNIADFLVARFAAPPKSEFMPRMIGAVTRAFERFAEPGNLAQTIAAGLAN